MQAGRGRQFGKKTLKDVIYENSNIRAARLKNEIAPEQKKMTRKTVWKSEKKTIRNVTKKASTPLRPLKTISPALF